MSRPLRPDRSLDPAGMCPVLWMTSDPGRLVRDQVDIHDFTCALEYQDPNPTGMPHGGWVGTLPRWSFERPPPAGLDELLGGSDFRVLVIYPAAYPMLPPIIRPIDPEPTIWEQTQAAWHVAPSGALCLLQSDSGWQPEASVTELLAKAVGWRIEYALMKAGVIDRMSQNGIVSDSSYDHLVAAAVQEIDPSVGTVEESGSDDSE